MVTKLMLLRYFFGVRQYVRIKTLAICPILNTYPGRQYAWRNGADYEVIADLGARATRSRREGVMLCSSVLTVRRGYETPWILPDEMLLLSSDA